MKNIPAFQSFLNDEVNINKDRLDKLHKRIETIADLLANNYEKFESYELQGSYATGTIIKPPKEKNFDADILVYVKYDDGFEPKDYIADLCSFFKEYDRYCDKITRNNRCVTIEYADGFNIDVVPCLERGNETSICNYRDNKYEVTDGTGYREWLNEKNRITNGYLKKVTRIFKYMRDIKQSFSCKSILMTTLLGNCVFSEDSNKYTDIPTSLHIIFERLNDYLQLKQHMPDICNPVLPAENFNEDNRHWNQEQYATFRDRVKLYCDRITQAINERGSKRSEELWQSVLGDAFKVPQSTVTSYSRPTKPYLQYPKYENKLQKVITYWLNYTVNHNEAKKAFLEMYPNIYFDQEELKGELGICAVYDGINLIFNPSHEDKSKYSKTFVNSVYEINIDLRGRVFEVGGKIKRHKDSNNHPHEHCHINPDGDCCLGIFENPNVQNLIELFRVYFHPFFYWYAHYDKYGKPPWRAYSHGSKGIEEYENDKKHIGRNDICNCGSGIKSKYCCGR